MTFGGIPTGTPGSVGRALMDFFINTKKVPEQVKSAMDKLAKDSDKMTKRAGEALGKSLGENMADEIENDNSFGRRITNALSRVFKRRREKITVDVDVDVDRDSANRAGSRIATALSSALSKAFKAGGGLFANIFQGLGGLVQSLGSSIGNVGSRGPFGAVIGAAILFGIPALVAAVAALLNVFAPLVNLVFLLPSALAVLGASIIPVVTAFSGLGDAIKAVASGDKLAIKEAFKNISASAQVFVKDIAKILPILKQIKLLTQEAFFQNLGGGQITRLVEGLRGPIIIGFQRVADAASEFAAAMLRAAGSAQVRRFIDALFSTSATIFERITPAATSIFIGLADLGVATLPIIERIFSKLGDLGARFGEWLSRISANGDLDAFFEDLKEALRDLGALATSGWNLVKAIVGATGEDERAQKFLDDIVHTIDRLEAFFASDTGKFAMQGLITLASIFLIIIESIIVGWVLIGVVVEQVRRSVDGLIEGLKRVWEWLNKIYEKSQSVRSGINFLSPLLGILLSGFADGGIVTSPTMAMIGEGGNPEVVIPLNDPARARELANTSGLSSMLNNDGGSGTTIIFNAGAVQIDFHGVVPSEQEAYQTGAAAGRGLSDQLARRDVRLGIRTR